MRVAESNKKEKPVQLDATRVGVGGGRVGRLLSTQGLFLLIFQRLQ